MREDSPGGVTRPRVRLGDQATRVTLRALAASGEPIGVWRVRDALRAAGVEVSEATVGRLLRELDYRGFSERVGVKSGRILTPEGRSELAALEQAQREDAYRTQFLQAIRVEAADDILDILGVRRTVEVEAARLAATRASAEDIARLERAARDHAQAGARGESGTEENNRFHLAVAQASKSNATLAVLTLIFHERQVHRTQVEMQRSAGSLVPQEHQRVLEAVRARQPEAAAAAMRAHIDRLIEAVEQYAAARAATGSVLEARP